MNYDYKSRVIFILLSVVSRYARSARAQLIKPRSWAIRVSRDTVAKHSSPPPIYDAQLCGKMCVFNVNVHYVNSQGYAEDSLIFPLVRQLLIFI